MATQLFDKEWINQTIERFATSVIAEKEGTSGLAIIGIQTRGAEIADRISAALKAKGEEPLTGYLDPTMFRDDLHTGAGLKSVKPTEINFDITERAVILVDDVLLTGRSVRAAIDGLLHYGRPACIRLCVMVDRGGRELPIQPDLVGAHVDVPKGGWVRIKLQKTDSREDAVYLVGRGDEEP